MAQQPWFCESGYVRLSSGDEDNMGERLSTVLPSVKVPLVLESESDLEWQELHNRNSRKWKLGLFLAGLSGFLCTANNFFIQFFKINGLEILLVRSVVQSVVLGILVFTHSLENIPVQINVPLQRFWIMKIIVLVQGFLGGFRLYLNFTCIGFMPLGDALTLIFTEPLFTIILAFVFLKIPVSIVKICMCMGLIVGMIMCIQPPLLFPVANDHSNSTSDEATQTSTHGSEYYFGALMAVGCAICGSTSNILINACSGTSTTTLVFVSGLFGILIAVIGCFIDQDSLVILNLEELDPLEWGILLLISTIGVLAYFAMTMALKAVTPTSVSVVRAIEIVLAFICQSVFMGVIPNAVCLFGASIVMGSVIGIAVDEKRNSA